MNTIKSLAFAGLAATALLATPTFATVCPAGTQGSPICINTVGGDGPGTSLQQKLDGMTTNPGDINVYTGQHSPSAYWAVNSTGLSENKFVFELAGNAAVNTFGIFDPADPGNRLALFGGSATTGWATQLEVFGDGHYKATYFDGAGVFQSQADGYLSTANLFGYYIGVPGGAFYSDTNLNESGAPMYAGGMPHMAAYAGDGSTSLTIGSFTGVFGSSEYLLAWEDRPLGASDLDYNDMVVLVESVHPVPEPATLGMFGVGILLVGVFVGMRRRAEG